MSHSLHVAGLSNLIRDSIGAGLMVGRYLKLLVQLDPEGPWLETQERAMPEC